MAKPIIDILGEVPDLSVIEALVPALETLGYDALGAHGIEGRRYFRRQTGGRRSHHLHVFATGAGAAWAHLALRDYLRCHPRECRVYAAAKESAAVTGAYQAAKAPFVSALVDRACDWASARHIVASYNDPSEQLCVDIRRDRFGYVWVMCRRDPEDSHGWRLTGTGGRGFPTAQEARAAAAKECPWIAP